MGWIFASVVLLLIVFLWVRYEPFRRGFRFTILGVLALGVVVIIGLFIENARLAHENARLKTLIKTDELKLSELMLEAPSGYSSTWELKGNVANLSGHKLESFVLRITVQNCPEPNQCIVVGETEKTIWAEVPPKQMRAFTDFVSLRNMPTLTNWKWFYALSEIKAQT